MEQKDHNMTPAWWADQTARAWYYQKATEQSAISELQAVLDGSQSAVEVAQSVAAIYEPHIEDGCLIMGKVCQFWCLFCEVAREFGGIREQAERLSDLLESMSRLPDVKRNIEGSVYWRDLPDFAIAFREYGFFEMFSEMCESAQSRHHHMPYRL